MSTSTIRTSNAKRVAAFLVAVFMLGACASETPTETSAQEPASPDADAGTDRDSGSSPTTATATSGTECDGDSVTAAVSGAASDAVLYVADAKGFFEEEGLQVDLQTFQSSSDMVAPLGTGQLDAAGTGTSAGFYNAVASGVGIKIVADKASIPDEPAERPYLALLVRPELTESGEVTSFADLEGLNVIDYAEATTTSAVLSRMLEEGGLTLEDVNRTFLRGTEHLQALQNGQADASISAEPVITNAVESGAAVLFAGSDEVYPGQQLSSLVYGDAFINDRPDVALCFMRAYLRAGRTYTDAVEGGVLQGEGADEIAGIISDYTETDIETLTNIGLNVIDPNGALDVESLQQDIEFFRSMGVLESDDVVAQDVVDTSIAEQAVIDLGPYEGS